MTAQEILLKKTDFPLLIMAVICGCMAAFLTIQNPVLGVMVVAGLIMLSVMTRRAEIPFSLLVFSFAIPVQKTLFGLPLNMADGIIVLWGMVWPFLMLRQDQSFKISYIVWAALPFIIASAFSLFVAINPGGSFKQIIRLVEWFAVLPVLMTCFQLDEKFWRWTIALFLLVPAFFAIDGVVEVLNNGSSITHMLGIAAPVPSEQLSKIRHTFDISGRAGSTFGGAQGLAMYLAMMMSVVFSVALLAPRPGMKKWAVLSLIICLAGMAVTKSRGGFLGALVLFGVILLAARPRLAIKIILAAGFVLACLLVAFLVVQGWDGTVAGLVPGRPEAVLDRLIIWSRALEVFASHPFLGVGFGGFRDAVYEGGGIRLNVDLGYESLHSHNTYLEVLTGTGIIGFLAYVIFLAACGWKLIFAWIHRSGGPYDCFILAAIGALAAYMVFGMVDMLFLQNMHLILVAILSLGFMAGQAGEEQGRLS